MAKVLIVHLVLGLPVSPAPLVGGLVAFAIYANDRLIDADRDALSDPERTAFVNRHRNLLFVLAALAYGLGTAIAAIGGPLAFGMVLFPGAAWLLYGVEWVPTPGLPYRRMKELVVVNSVLVASAWSLSVVLVPVAFADSGLSPLALVLVLYFGLGTFVNTEIANASDTESDTRNGIETLPTVLGIRRTCHVLYAITLAIVMVLALATLAGYLSLAVAGALSVGPLALLVVLTYLGSAGRTDLLVVAAECTRLPVFCALLATAYVG
jgi:4-hydroxybenzoate polyprenyltransferase